MVYACGDCDRVFYSGWVARDQHCRAVGHDRPEFECDDCDEYFVDEDDRREHMDYFGHWGPDAVECTCCDLTLPNETIREQHHIDEHLFCGECHRFFQNRNNIQQHLSSQTHRTTSVTCPFCRGQWGTATGLVHHLERGSCPRAPLDRNQLYRVIREHDPNHTIANKLLGFGDTDTYECTEQAWNPFVEAYECYLCHNLFNSLHALNQHITSPRHQQNLYHCPKPTCPKQFSTLAALMNHLESEACSFMRFQAVQRNVHRIINPHRMIRFT